MTTFSRARAAAVLSVLALAVPTAVAATGGVADATPSTPAAHPASTPRLFVYAGGEAAGAEVQSLADARAHLRGTGGRFKRFVGGLADGLAADKDCAAADYTGVTVFNMRTDGFASGAVNCAGGYEALWAVVDGSWKEIFGTQDTWDCRVLRKHDVPSDIVGDTCFAYHGDHREHAYHQA